MKRVFIATGIIAAVGGLATATLSASCDTVCTLEAAPSVVLQVLADGSSTPSHVPAEDVWYMVTDPSGAEHTKRGTCLDDECTEWILGYEVEGEFEIHATVCGQEYTTSATVEMDQDGCHVETQWAQVAVDTHGCPELAVPPEGDSPTLAAPPVKECTLDARPSVIADVVAERDRRLTPVAPDRVWYSWDGDRGDREWPGTCMTPDCSTFMTGWEKAGEFTVNAEVCGKTFSERASVTKDDENCHVETQRLQIEVDLGVCQDKPPFVDGPDVKAPCDLKAYPSAYVSVVTDGGDVWLPYPTEGLTFWHDDTRGEGLCLEEREDGKCAIYQVGWEQAGRFKVETETCDHTSGTEFTVEMTSDNCHPSTQFIPLFVDTKGCIGAQPPSNPDPEAPEQPI